MEEYHHQKITIGDRLESIRAMHRFEQKEFIKILNTSKHTYVKIKTNKKSLPLDWVIFLKEKFGVNPDWLCYGVGEVFIKDNNAS